MASDSASDAEQNVTKQPMLTSPPPLVEVPDSDADNTQPPAAANQPDDAEGQMRQIIDRINADSDDDRASDGAPDFGDDEEVEESPELADIDEATTHLPVQVPPVQSIPESESPPPRDPEPQPQPHVATPPPQPAKKKTRPPAKRSKELLPAKGIKKTASPVAVKTKARPSSKTGAIKTTSKATATKADGAKTGSVKVASSKTSANKLAAKASKTGVKTTVNGKKGTELNVAGLPSVKPRSNGTGSTAKVAKSVKAAPKSSAKKKASAANDAEKTDKVETPPKMVKTKPTAKVKAGVKKDDKGSGTATKVKKTIAKKASPVAKKGKDVHTPVKTYSKKMGVAATKTSPSTAAKKKGDGKTMAKTPIKGSAKVKGRKKKVVEPSEEDDEDGGDVEMASEGEASDDGIEAVSADEEDESEARTPTGKMGIIGNVACSSRDTNTQALLSHAVQQLGQYNIVEYGADWDVALTAYVIGSETKRGWGILQALASGVPLVTEDWVSKSISEGDWQDMNAFRCDRFGQSPQRVDAVAGHAKMLEGLRVKVKCDGGDRGSVRKLVRLCGGRVAETRMDVVINDTEKAVDGSVNVSKKWLADSIEAGAAIEFEPYRTL